MAGESYLLKGSEYEFETWRAHAEAQGISLAAFLRNAANDAVARTPKHVHVRATTVKPEYLTGRRWGAGGTRSTE